MTPEGPRLRGSEDRYGLENFAWKRKEMGFRHLHELDCNW